MNRKPIILVAAAIFIVLIVGVVAFLIIQSQDATKNTLIEVSDSETALCAFDTKMCPDGSFVIRDFTNNCVFFSCPSVSGPVVSSPVGTLCTMEVKMCADGTEVGRESGRNCQFKLCPDGTQL